MSNQKSKRDLVLGLLDSDNPDSYIPAGFFTHFDPEYHTGQAAVDKHLEFVEYTGMDIVKIQYEAQFPAHPEIQHPEDWSKMPVHGIDYYAEALKVIEGLVNAASKDALVIVTLYSLFMLAGRAVGNERILEHLKTVPEQTAVGMQAITDSWLLFIRECIRLGVDGFYAATQGGETNRLGNSETFRKYVKPFDLQVMNEINEKCTFNILHVCDFTGSYDDISQFLDYPGHVVNCSLNVGSKQFTPDELSEMFNRPFMGGLDRLAVISSGNPEQVREESLKLLNGASNRFILAASCTIPGEVSWDNMRTAIQTAHEFADQR